jgi:hypothetical protein
MSAMARAASVWTACKSRHITPVLADQQAVLVAQIEIETAHSKRFQNPPEH